MRSEAVVIPDDLVQAARAGDPAALDRLWEACSPLLEQALQRTRHRPATLDPADVAQEAALVFLDVLRNGEGVAPADALPRAPAGFGRTLARALQVRLRTYLRAERRRLGRQVLADEATVERALARQAGGTPFGGPPGRQIERALAHLSPRQRAVIAGLYFDDLEVRALAARLQVRPQAITALHRRALAALREQLTQTPTPPAPDG